MELLKMTLMIKLMEDVAMKKIYLFAVCALALFSCQKEQNVPEEDGLVPKGYTQLTLKAVSDVTKTTLDGTSVKWASEDKIKVICDDGPVAEPFEIVSGVGEESGSFAGYIPAGKTALYTVYPAASYSVVSGTTVKVVVPASQEGDFGSCNIAVANVAADHSMAFRNVNAFISFTVPAGVTKVVVSSVDESPLAGTLSVDCSGTYPAATTTYESTASSITATLAGKAGTYYVSALPGQAHAYGLLFEFYKGEDKTGTYWLNKAITTGVNNVYGMGEVSTSGDYYVTDEGGALVKNGMSWATAWSADQFWSKIHLNKSDPDKTSAKLANINGATFHLAAGTYKWGADAAINIDESETISFTIKGESGTIFTGDDDADGTGDHRILSLGGNMNVTFEGIRFENGKVTDGNGGALNISAGQWTFTSCTFSGNEASGNGGAINLSGGAATIYKSVFDGNEAGVDGGAINVSQGALLEVLKASSNTQFTNNEATRNGGAVSIASKNSGIDNRINYADFKGNSATNGGAVAVCGGTVAEETAASEEAGEAVELPSKLVFSNCKMGTKSSDGNTTSNRGGAIYLANNFYVNVGNSTMKYNSASSNNGGAIAIEGWGRLELFRSYFYGNFAKSGGVVYTQGASDKYAEFFVDECSFEDNYITDRWGCIFNVNGIKQFSMYNSSAKGSYTKASSSYRTGQFPSWIAVDGVQEGGCVSFGNCSIIGDTRYSTSTVLTSGTALIALMGSQINYFTNCIIVPNDSGVASINGDKGTEKIDLYYTFYNTIDKIGTNTNSDGNVGGIVSTDIGSLDWDSNCWTWDGNISSAAPTMATKDGVYGRINTICHDFVTWSGSDFVKDQRGTGRGNGDWWPGAYQNN